MIDRVILWFTVAGALAVIAANASKAAFVVAVPLLAAIALNKGRFPRAEEQENPRRPRQEPFASAEAPFTTRHCSVLLSEDGEVLETDSVRVEMLHHSFRFVVPPVYAHPLQETH